MYNFRDPQTVVDESQKEIDRMRGRIENSTLVKAHKIHTKNLVLSFVSSSPSYIPNSIDEKRNAKSRNPG